MILSVLGMTSSFPGPCLQPFSYTKYPASPTCHPSGKPTPFNMRHSMREDILGQSTVDLHPSCTSGLLKTLYLTRH